MAQLFIHRSVQEPGRLGIVGHAPVVRRFVVYLVDFEVGTCDDLTVDYLDARESEGFDG